MEQRLIHYQSVGPTEGPMTMDPMRQRELVNQTALNQLNPLGDKFGTDLATDAVLLSQDPNRLQQHLHHTFEDVPRHANAIAEGYAHILTPEYRQAILNRISGDTLRDELEKMLEAVTTAVDTSEGESFNHRYLRGKKAAQGAYPWYGIDFHKVEEDKKIIASLKAANPDIAGDLATLEAALNEYPRIDPSLPADRWGLVETNKGDKQAMKMAKFAAIIVAASAAVLTGVMALGRREGFMAPLLYAGIAGLLASPDLRRTIFGSKAENILAQVDRTVNAPDFKENAAVYTVAGPEWRAFVDNTMSSPAETKKFLKALSRHPVDSPLNTELIDEYVNGSMPEGEGRENLRRMIMDKKFPSFASRLMSATNNDARDVVLEYVGQGLQKFENIASKSAQEAKELCSPPQKQYLGLGLQG